MNKKLLQLSLLAGLAFTSCEKDNSPEVTQETSIFKTTNDASKLGSKVDFKETGIIGLSAPDANRGAEAAWIFGIEQIAFLNPPSINGVELRATHVDVKGDYAYVSYNKEGATYLGGIDIVDISDQYHPVLTSRMTTESTDINSLYIDENDNLIFTGAINEGGNGRRTLLGYVAVSNGEFASEWQMDQGYSGNAGVHVLNLKSGNGDYTVFVSGDNGIIGAYNYYTSYLPGEPRSFKRLELGDLRYAAAHEDYLAVLSGTEGLLKTNVLNGLEVVASIPTEPLTAESKRTLTWYGENIFVSEGSKGVGVYNFDAGSKIATLPLSMHPDAEMIGDDDRVTNAVSTDDHYVYMANGGAGLDILKLNDNLEITHEGIAEIAGSANFVEAKGEFIYMATGTGLRILHIIDSEETALADSFLDCANYEEYAGDKNLTVPSSAEVSYSGLLNLKHLNVEGILNVCGDMNIEKSANIGSFGTVNMNGNFNFGNEKNDENLVINSGSTFKIAGKMTIYGDLYIESGGTLEFVGEDSAIYVSGEVKIKSGGEVIGTYEDLNNKFE